MIAFAIALCVAVQAPSSRYVEDYPVAKSKKGLQVQMVDDALALGVQHAGLNVVLSSLIDPKGDASNPKWEREGKVYRFDRHVLEGLDRDIKTLSDHGVLVSAILLDLATGDAQRDRILLHPNYDAAAPNRMSAFNTKTDEGRAWFTATLEFLAERWSRPDRAYGRVVNWILGNEVNSHWWWSNEGRVELEDFAVDYERSLRLAFEAIRSQSSCSRLFVSLEHHWTIHYAAGDDHQAFAAKPFLERLNELTKANGDFEWNVAFHPYPENLFDCRTWRDVSAIDSAESPRITFKNIQVLPRFLAGERMLCHGVARRAILSEQGFHTTDAADGELNQAAAFCFAWKKVEHLDGVDAFILHRHVDHADEGGLRLGLWTRDPKSSSPCQPLAKKKLYEIFRVADTPACDDAFRFALPIVGIGSWSELAH